MWIAHITYIPTEEGWLYLAVVFDLCSRAIVGWALDKRMTAQLVADVLTMALWRRGNVKGLPLHSDRAVSTPRGIASSCCKTDPQWVTLAARQRLHPGRRLHRFAVRPP